MDLEQTLPKGSRKGYYGCKESQQKSITRETLQAGSSPQCPTSVRPPPTGEDSKDTERSKANLLASLKQESFLASPRMTPRRFTKKESIAVRGHSGLESDEEKLAPLGFEPEGSAASTPQCERWPTSLNDMLMDCQGFNSFYQFLRLENREILLDFWRASESFKRMAPTSPEMRTTAKAIFQKFIFAGSSDALEISDTTKGKIAQHVNDQSVDCGLFEEALSEIMADLKNNHYPKFMNTSLYKECVQSGGESPRDICDRYPQSTVRFHGGYLPTLPEEKVLGFEEIEDDGDQFEFEQHRKSVKGSSHCGKRSGSDEHNARCLLHCQVPIKRLLSPYHYPTAPVGSRIESENQSLSSDAMTEDTLSLTDSAYTDDTSSRCSGGRHRCSSRKKAADYHHDGLSLIPFIPRTQRVPKEARHPLASNPREFARILTEKLEKVKLEQELHEREARNLSAHFEMPKKSILQQAIEASSKKVPLSTMAMSVVPEAVTSYKDQYQYDNVSGGVESGAPSTSAAAPEASDTYTQRNLPQQAQRSKPPAPEPKEVPVEPQPDVPTKEGNLWETRPGQRDDDIPFLTVNHHRIMQWMEEGEQAQQGPPREPRHHRHHPSSTKNTSKSKQSTASSVRQSDKGSRHLPYQPIASDTLMPPLPAPHPSSVLEEAKRKLIEVKAGERRSKHHPKQRSLVTGEIETSHRGKNGASSSCSTVDYPGYGHSSSTPHEKTPSVAGSSLMSSVSHCDTISKDSGFTGSIKKNKESKEKNVTITYYLWGEPIPYRTTLPGRFVTLGQFKSLLPPRKGTYKFYFKRSTGDRDCKVVYEEVKDDSEVLPTFDGQVVGKVERIDS